MGVVIFCHPKFKFSVVLLRRSCILSSFGQRHKWLHFPFSAAVKQLGHLSVSDSLQRCIWTLMAQKFECCFVSQIMKPEVLFDSASSIACQLTVSNCSDVQPRWVHINSLALILLHSNLSGCEISKDSLWEFTYIAQCLSGRRSVFGFIVPVWKDLNNAWDTACLVARELHWTLSCCSRVRSS